MCICISICIFDRLALSYCIHTVVILCVDRGVGVSDDYYHSYLHCMIPMITNSREWWNPINPHSTTSTQHALQSMSLYLYDHLCCSLFLPFPPSINFTFFPSLSSPFLPFHHLSFTFNLLHFPCRCIFSACSSDTTTDSTEGLWIQLSPYCCYRFHGRARSTHRENRWVSEERRFDEIRLNKSSVV